jgi:hypothetical protein
VVAGAIPGLPFRSECFDRVAASFVLSQAARWPMCCASCDLEAGWVSPLGLRHRARSCSCGRTSSRGS